MEGVVRKKEKKLKQEELMVYWMTKATALLGPIRSTIVVPLVLDLFSNITKVAGGLVSPQAYAHRGGAIGAVVNGVLKDFEAVWNFAMKGVLGPVSGSVPVLGPLLSLSIVVGFFAGIRYLTTIVKGRVERRKERLNAMAQEIGALRKELAEIKKNTGAHSP
jgi:hypothetical protein